MGMLADSFAPDNEGIELPKELQESVLGQMQDVVNLKGLWPPSDKVRGHLETLVDTIVHVEQKTGIKFSRDIVLMGGQSGHFAVDGNHNVQIDFSITSEHSPLSKDAVEAILFHEAGHIKNRDHEHQANIGQHAGTINFIASLAEFYKDEPDKFAHIVREEFGSPKNFRLTLKRVMDAADTALSGVETHPEYSKMTDLRMLDLLTQKSDISSAMLAVPPPTAEEMGDIIKLHAAFGMKSKKHHDFLRKYTGAMEMPFDESFLSMMSGNCENSPAITEQEKRTLDSIQRNIFIPSQTRHDALMNLLGSYSRAAEFRADDIAVINATHPELYSESLRSIVLHAQHAASTLPPKMQELQQTQQKIFESHPDIASRVDRSERLLKRINTASHMCGEVDIDAAIAAVNKEIINGRQKPPSKTIP